MINMVKMAVLPKLHGTPCNPRKNFSINIDIKKLIVKDCKVQRRGKKWQIYNI